MYTVECTCDRDSSGNHLPECLLNRADYSRPNECPACGNPLDVNDPHDPACPLWKVIPGDCQDCAVREAGRWSWAKHGRCPECDKSADEIADLADSLV